MISRSSPLSSSWETLQNVKNRIGVYSEEPKRFSINFLSDLGTNLHSSPSSRRGEPLDFKTRRAHHPPPLSPLLPSTHDSVFPQTLRFTPLPLPLFLRLHLPTYQSNPPCFPVGALVPSFSDLLPPPPPLLPSSFSSPLASSTPPLPPRPPLFLPSTPSNVKSSKRSEAHPIQTIIPPKVKEELPLVLLVQHPSTRNACPNGLLQLPTKRRVSTVSQGRRLRLRSRLLFDGQEKESTTMADAGDRRREGATRTAGRLLMHQERNLGILSRMGSRRRGSLPEELPVEFLNGFRGRRTLSTRRSTIRARRTRGTEEERRRSIRRGLEMEQEERRTTRRERSELVTTGGRKRRRHRITTSRRGRCRCISSLRRTRVI